MGHVEERLVWRLIEAAPPGQRDRYWQRAEKLSENTHPSRASRLGWIMTRMGESARAIPLLRGSVAETKDRRERERVEFTLFEAHLHTLDWRAAEGLFPVARSRLTSREIPDWCGRIAMIAAKGGALDDAMRIWRRRCNLDFGDLRGLDRLAGIPGMRQRLRQFYLAAKGRAADSWVPDRALELLGQ